MINVHINDLRAEKLALNTGILSSMSRIKKIVEMVVVWGGDPESVTFIVAVIFLVCS